MPEPGRLIGTGKVAEVFAWGELALKLYRPGADKASAFREAAILAQVERLGLPAPRVEGVLRHEERWGVLMTRVPAGSWAELVLAHPERVSEVVASMAALHARIHACPGAGFPHLRDRLLGNIERAPGLPELLRARLLDRTRAAAYADRLCHGDFHPFNVLGSLENGIVVDWLDATAGSPAADICRSYLLLRMARPEFAEATLRAGAEASGLAVETILAWLPLLAAARLAEHVPAEAPALIELAAT